MRVTGVQPRISRTDRMSTPYSSWARLTVRYCDWGPVPRVWSDMFASSLEHPRMLPFERMDRRFWLKLERITPEKSELRPLAGDRQRAHRRLLRRLRRGGFPGGRTDPLRPTFRGGLQPEIAHLGVQQIRLLLHGV